MTIIHDHLASWGQPLMTIPLSEFIALCVMALAYSMWLVYDAGA